MMVFFAVLLNFLTERQNLGVIDKKASTLGLCPWNLLGVPPEPHPIAHSIWETVLQVKRPNQQYRNSE